MRRSLLVTVGLFVLWIFAMLPFYLWQSNPDVVFSLFPILTLLACALGVAFCSTQSKSLARRLWEIFLVVPLVIVTASLSYGLQRRLFFDVMHVPSASMSPTLNIGDFTFVKRRGEAKIGDIGVWSGWDGSDFMTKRVVATKDEVIDFTQNKIKVQSGPVLQQPCSLLSSPDPSTIYRQETLGTHTYCVIVADSEEQQGDEWREKIVWRDYFVIGDNRIHSFDSRDDRWSFPLTKENLNGIVIGKAKYSLKMFKTFRSIAKNLRRQPTPP